MPSYLVKFPENYKLPAGNILIAEGSTIQDAIIKTARETGVPAALISAEAVSEKTANEIYGTLPGLSGQGRQSINPGRYQANPDFNFWNPFSSQPKYTLEPTKQTTPFFQSLTPYTLGGAGEDIFFQDEMLPSVYITPSGKTTKLSSFEREAQNLAAQNAAGSYYGTADDPNAGQFSVVNPFAQGGRSAREVGPLQVYGTQFTIDPLTGNAIPTTPNGQQRAAIPLSQLIQDASKSVSSVGDGDGGDGGGDGGGGDGGGGEAVSPTEGFLAVLSAIQSMADVAPGGLFNLNALLAAITANPSLYLIEETTPITNPDGTTTYIKNRVINPVVAQLLDLQASGQTNLTNIELERILQTANVDIKRIEGENAVNLAKENNASAEEIQRIQSAAQEAVGLAQAAATETAAKYGATSPFGALAGAGASVDEVSRLAESLARGGMNPQDAIRQALATTGGAYGALGGIADGYTVGDIAMLARGGLTPEQQLAQARVQALPGLATISPQSLGGLSAILGQEAVRGLFSPFTGQAQQPQMAQQAQTRGLSNTVQPFSTMQTMGGAMGGAMGAPTPTLGRYERLTPFEQGVAGANIAATGQDIEQAILGVTPGSTAARGSLAAQAL